MVGGNIFISKIKGNELEIPKPFMESVFSNGGQKVVIKEIENGICVESIDQEAVRSLVESIKKLK